ncbi:MAG: hypothetical protein QOI34_411, partial [Verrucomicrobiota bacterium]
MALAVKRNYEEALRSFDTAVHRYPTNADAYYNRAVFYFDRHQYEFALGDFDIVVRLAPTELQGSIARGAAYLRVGRYEEAMADFNKVLNLYPEGAVRAGALNNRAWIEAACPDARFRNGPQAVIDAKQAVDYGLWHKASCLGTLAAAYAEVADFDSAIKYVQQAIAAQKGSDILEGANEQLTAYQQRRHWRIKAETKKSELS